MDPYSLLDIAPGADAAEIKRAFRRLAMRWHPDRNPAPEAHDHFNALRAAHDSLLAELAAGTAAGDDEDLADTDDEAPAPAPSRRGPDRRQTLEIRIEDACLGGEKIVVVADESVCGHCHGSGETALAHTRLCATCHGSGRLRAARGLVQCAVCGGRGFVSKAACAHCGGSGRERTERRLAVQLPPGLLTGDELRLAGEGEAAADASAQPGDLRLTIALAPHPLYRAEGRDLHLRRPLSVFRLLAGGDIDIPLPGGCRTATLPPGGATRQLRLEGAGIPGRGGRPGGAAIIELAPLLPEAVDAATREALDAADLLMKRRFYAELPELADWEARWLDAD
ncbi:DnaJ C-terminal domain-containing protein [Azoarcus olearius]|uniref:Chaperone protein DnaJ n=1 Tax=Azoarcus sp. (strain BH72) TaxID=418699 RepID=A1K4X8_AZOSB|nr:DnaJ C-terminal domain-containing protein [Azoarcus olearius]CAL93883.1 putative chaperone protein DnaJ [Azoarcus olearius]